MNFWERLSRKFPRRTHSAEAQLTLTRAYRSVFYGIPDRSQQQMVLADLQARCFWSQYTAPSGASSEELWYREGKRAAYGEIFAHLSLSPDDITALDNAARHETVSQFENAASSLAIGA